MNIIIYDNKQISLSNIPSDIHHLGISKKILNQLIEKGVFFISQIERMTEFELKQLKGISSYSAAKIKTAFYSYRWKINRNKKIQTIEDLKSLIHKSHWKKDILKTGIEVLHLPASTYKVFDLANVRTIGDILQLKNLHPFRFKGIGRIKYDELINSILEVLFSYKEEFFDTYVFLKIDPLDASLYTQSNLTFLEVFTMLLNTVKPRDWKIFFENYLICHAQHGAYTRLADKYDLTKERIRQICNRTLRIFQHHRRKKCIRSYLNTVWREKVHNFVKANGGYITIVELEQDFADDLPSIYFLQDEILNIDDIWANVLSRDERYYYLPN